MMRRWLNQIDVEAVRKNSVITLARRIGERSRAAPRVNHDVFRQFRLQNFVLTDHLLAILLQDLEQARVEVSLERVVVLDPFSFHKRLDRRVAVPLLAFVLVTADVHVLVGEERRHFAQKAVKELVDLFASRIERGLEDARTPFDRVWTRSAAEFGITNEPARAVPGNIKLRHHANAALACVSDDVFYLFLCVVIAVGSELMQFRILLAFNTKALVLCQVPVKDVHLHSCEAIEITFEHFNRLEVTSDVDQQPAPRKAWLVLN